MDTTTKLPNSLSPEQDFRVRVARNDLERAHELDLAGASVFDVAQAAGALRASLHNVLAIIDDLVQGGPTASPVPAPTELLTPSCAVAKHNPDLHEWCGYPGTVTATGWTRIPCAPRPTCSWTPREPRQPSSSPTLKPAAVS